MRMTRRARFGALAALALATAGGTAAIAATGSGAPAEESKAVVAAAAGDLGVSTAELTAALKKALVARVDAKLKAGTITEAQATALKARIGADSFPLLQPFGGRHGGPGRGHGEAALASAASYLGMTSAELRASLEGGTTLAALARATDGKSVDGLVSAIVAAEKKGLAAAVADGRLTEAQRAEIQSQLESRTRDLVNGAGPARGHARGHGGTFEGGMPA